MGAKRAVALSLDADLVERAERLKLDLSRALEAKLREVVTSAEAKSWEEENREAIESFNRYIAEHGTVGEEFRREAASWEDENRSSIEAFNERIRRDGPIGAAYSRYD